MRRDPIYHTTYTGKPPDEPAMLGVALNEVFVPLLQKQFPEIIDFYLPPEGCSYRLAVVEHRKAYAGHAKRVMFGVWSSCASSCTPSSSSSWTTTSISATGKK